MKFHFITGFPESLVSYFDSSLMKKAKDKKIAEFNFIDLRNFAFDKHKKIDDRPFGGGPGMVLKLEPIFLAVNSIFKKINKRKNSKPRVVLFSVSGKKFTQKEAVRLSRYSDLIFICGHYEGVDERVARYVCDEEISLGDFVLSGGEIPAMAVTDAVCRFLPGFLGNIESLETKRFLGKTEKKLPSFSAYTRPEIFYPDKKNKRRFWKVPKVLLSGRHEDILNWRLKNQKND